MFDVYTIDAWMQANAEDAQVALFFIVFAVLAVVEHAAPLRAAREGRGTRWLANLLLTALNIVTLSLLPVTFLGAALWAQSAGFGLLNVVALPTMALVVVNLLARGFLSWFTHYLMHRAPWLWRIHRVHHLDTEMDVSTTVRMHPLEFVMNALIGVPLLVALGLTPWLLLAYEILDAFVVLFSHANIRLPRPVERMLRYVIVTPDLHRVHHSSWQPETDSNFSAVFPIWDVLLGTFRTETREPQTTMELGLEEIRDARTNRLDWLLSVPFMGRFERAEPPGERGGSAVAAGRRR